MKNPRLTNFSYSQKIKKQISKLNFQYSFPQDVHFPSFMNQLHRDHKFNIEMSYREQVLAKIAYLIEKKGGRSKPTICESVSFEKNKEVVEGEIRRKKHINERDWPECVNVFTESLKSLKEMVLDNVSSEDESDYTDMGRNIR